MASTNFDMDSDESNHTENEFYYTEEMENYNDKENINLQHESQQCVQLYIEKITKLFPSLENLRPWAVSKTSGTVFSLEYGPPCW